MAANWLGDTFWALQVIPWLKQYLPDAEINILVRSDNEWLARLWAPDDRIQVVTGVISDRRREGSLSVIGLWREATRLRQLHHSIDAVIDLTGTPASALLTWFLKPALSLGPEFRWWSRLFYHQSQDMNQYFGHLATRPWFLLSPWMADDRLWPEEKTILSPKLPRLTPVDQLAPKHSPTGILKNSPTNEPGNLPENPPGKTAVLIPGAGWPQKQWPVECYHRLALKLGSMGWRVKILLAQAQMESFSVLTSIESKVIESFCFTGEELVACLAETDVVVANDSGPAHLSAAMGVVTGVATITIFGPTNPSFCRPLGKQVTILRTSCVQRPEGDIHHCHNQPAFSCQDDCTASVTVEMVLAAIDDNSE